MPSSTRSCGYTNIRSERNWSYSAEPSEKVNGRSLILLMGKDGLSVVGVNLSVNRIKGLSIAGASVLPRVSTGDIMTSTVIIGGRMADILLGKTG